MNVLLSKLVNLAGLGRAALLILTTISSVAIASDWPLARYSASRNASSPEELPAKLALAWSLDLPRLNPGWPDQPRLQFDAVYQPIIVDGRIIVSSPHDDSIAAYELANGKELWRFMTGGPVRLPPASDGKRVFAGSDDGYLYALDPKNGSPLWKFKGAPKDRRILGNGRLIDTWPVRGGPVVADGKVYFAAGIWPFMGIFVHCLDAESGKVIWSNTGDGSAFLTQPHGAKAFSGIAPQGGLAIIGERLLIPNGRSEAASFERATGKMQYFSFANKFGGHEVLAAEKFFFCGGLVFDIKDGKPVGNCVQSPVILGDTLFGFSATMLQALDLTSEVKLGPTAKLGRLPPPRFLQSVATAFQGGKALIHAGKRVYAGGPGKIAAFDLPLRPGDLPDWETPVNGTVMYLAASAGHLIASTDTGQILCFSADGKGAATPVTAAETAKDPSALAPVVRALLDDAHTDAGWAVVLGASGLELAKELSLQSHMQTVILESDAAKANAARRELRERGLYGERISVVAADLKSAALPPYFANLIVGSDSAGLSLDDAACRALIRSLHPYSGVAYLSLDAKSIAIATLAATESNDHVRTTTFKEQTKIARIGGIPGAGNWTHEHADASNTRVGKDTVVRAPLGLLWYGGTSHEGILPRHGHGPQPQVVDGKLIIEGMDMLRAVDIYTGRQLWEASLPGIGSYYNNLTHHPGANGTGTNYVSMPDGIYVAMDRSCVRLDPNTGAKIGEFPLPPDAPSGMIWGYLNVIGDYLIGGVALPIPAKEIATPPKKKEDDEDTVDEEAKFEQSSALLPRAVASSTLFVLDRKSGKQLWSANAESEFRHNAICAGGGKLFAIDRVSRPTSKQKIENDALYGSLRVFDLQSGAQLWRCAQQVSGTWLSYSEENDVLVESGRTARDVLKDESKGMRGFRGKDGTLLWTDPKAAAPAMIRGATVLKEKNAIDLMNGEPITFADPITGRIKEWSWTRQYGCNTPAASQNLITFRSGAAGYYDLDRYGGTGNFGGFRSSCTHNLLVAGGVLCAPDYTRTCTCSYQLQTSLALIPDADAEMWTYIGTSDDVKESIQRIGINLAAHGDRVDEKGTVWLEHPSTGGPSPKIEIKCDPDQPEIFRRHSSLVSGPMNWVTASGMRKIKSLKVTMNSKTPRPFTVRLYFCEPDGLPSGARVFNVSLQGQVVLPSLDISAESGGSNCSLIKEFKNIMIGPEFKLEMKPAKPTMSSVLCGVELIAE